MSALASAVAFGLGTLEVTREMGWGRKMGPTLYARHVW